MQPAAAQVSNTPVFDPNDPVQVYDAIRRREPVDGDGQLPGQYAISENLKKSTQPYKHYGANHFARPNHDA
jgi:hypothetical protein